MGVRKKKRRDSATRPTSKRYLNLKKKLASVLEDMETTQSEKAANYFAEIMDSFYVKAQIEDVLADIQHWCAEYEIDFEDALLVARKNFKKEREIHDKIYNDPFIENDEV